MELAKNQEHTVTIEGYGEGGMGVARIDGRVVFVHGARRGEKCRVLILKTLKSVAFAKVLEVIEPSSERIESDCPYFPRCGGCTYRHIRYEEELRLKKQRVQDNLSRIGGSDATVEEILGAQDTLRYRNKAQYPVSKDGAVGFYRARTHEVIDTGLSRSSVRSREAGSVPLGSNSSTSAAGWTDTWSTLDSATLTSFTSSASSSTV